MNDMPEQIWAISRFDTWNARGPDGYWSKDLTGSRHYEEYTRADLTKPTVKPLEWDQGIVHWARPLPGMKYIACSSEGATWVWWLEGDCLTREVQRSPHESESAAKAAAQADYERRILSALEDTWTP